MSNNDNSSGPVRRELREGFRSPSSNLGHFVSFVNLPQPSKVIGFLSDTMRIVGLRFRCHAFHWESKSPSFVSEKNPMKRNEKPALTYSSPRKFVHVVRQMNDVPNERRTNTRVPKRLTLTIQPLNDDFGPDGEPFCAISSDMSQKGMGFICDDAMSHEFVRIMLTEEDVSVIARVRHSTSIGTQFPLYLIGVEFLDEYLV